MSVQNILDDNGKIDPAYIGAAASYGFVTNPLSAPLLCYNPTTLVNHPIIEASYVSGSSIKTDNLEQLPGSLQNRIRVDTNLQMATGRDLQFETNGVVTAVGNLDLTAGTGNIALTGGGTFSALMFGDNYNFNGSGPGLAAVNVDGNLTLKGTVPSVSFKNSSDVVKAFIDYSESSDQLYLNCAGKVAAEAVAYGGRVILDAAGATLSSTDLPTLLQRSQTGVGVKTITTLEDNGVFQVGAAGIGTNPSLDLVPTSGLNATIAADGTGLQQTTGGNIVLNAASGNINLTTPSVLLGGITTYDTAAGVQVTVQAAVDNLDQVLTNNAYVPMTWYKRDIGFTIDPAVSLAFQTPDFVWRYSGGFATGTNSESRYCGTLKYQIDVNISAEDLNDTVVWWVRLFNINTSAPYYSTDFPDERFGFVADRVVNPYSGVRNQCVSFSSTFDLEPGFTGQAVPVDGEIMRIEVYGWGNSTTTTPRAQVSATIRPLRLLQ